MRFSRSLKSSAHSLPSPDGDLIATLLPSQIIVRRTRSLGILRVIEVSGDDELSAQWFLWSPSSTRILLSVGRIIHIYPIRERLDNLVISHPTSNYGKITAVAFGATDDEICIFSEFGLKMTVFNLSTQGTSVDIFSPKFFLPGNWSKGFAYRPRTRNLALLSRKDGKDVISIHSICDYEVFRSWNPDTVDAQSLSWSADGWWLAVVESAAQGHRILFYTVDGILYRTWHGPIPTAQDNDIALGAGAKMVEWSPRGDYVAIADYSSRVTLLSVPWFSGTMSLNHTTAIKSTSGVHIWQEHVLLSPTGTFTRNYIPSAQPTYPPTTEASPAIDSTDSKSGVSILSFDASGTLLATRSDLMPTTLWIWSLATNSLLCVLIQHSPIAKVTWHSVIPELIMVRCEGDESRGLAHFWEPTWETPKIVDYGTQVPDGKIIGRSIARWLAFNDKTPSVFFSDTQDCILAVLEDVDDPQGQQSPAVPWQEAVQKGVDIYGEYEESPLNLVPANERRKGRGLIDTLMNEPTMTNMSGGSDEVDDTFRFRKFVEP